MKGKTQRSTELKEHNLRRSYYNPLSLPEYFKQKIPLKLIIYRDQGREIME